MEIQIQITSVVGGLKIAGAWRADGGSEAQKLPEAFAPKLHQVPTRIKAMLEPIFDSKVK